MVSTLLMKRVTVYVTGPESYSQPGSELGHMVDVMRNAVLNLQCVPPLELPDLFNKQIPGPHSRHTEQISTMEGWKRHVIFLPTNI